MKHVKFEVKADDDSVFAEVVAFGDEVTEEEVNQYFKDWLREHDIRIQWSLIFPN